MLAVAFVAVDVVSMRSAQLAVEDGTDATAIVTATMIVATVGTAPFALVAEAGADKATFLSAAMAALVVAALGTVGRVLRTEALPSAGVPAVAASSQVTALGTAVGGVVAAGRPPQRARRGLCGAGRRTRCRCRDQRHPVAAVPRPIARCVARPRTRYRPTATRPQRDSRQYPNPSKPCSPSTSPGSPSDASTLRLSAASRATWG